MGKMPAREKPPSAKMIIAERAFATTPIDGPVGIAGFDQRIFKITASVRGYGRRAKVMGMSRSRIQWRICKEG